ncbi:putative transporter, partial [Hortaea werneckii]
IATTLLGWRASYWFFAIVGLAFFFIGLWTIPKDTTAKEPLNRETFFKFDVIAMVCVIFGVGMFSAALSLGESAPQGWKTGYVLALLIAGLFLLVAFVVWDCYYKFPLVPMDIWKDRNFSVCMAILVLGFMAFTPGSFFIALYFQDVWHQSAIMVAVRLLPMAIAGILVNLVAGLVLHRVSNKLLMLIGTSGYAAAFILLSVQRHDTSYWALCFPAFILLVVGADLEFNVANMYVMSSMPPSQQSIAGGIFQTVAKLSMTIGFGIATAVFSSVEKNPSLDGFWDPVTQPYTAVMWLAAACSLLSVCLVPLLTLGTQGGKDGKAGIQRTPTEDTVSEQEKVGGEKRQAEAMVAQTLPPPVHER